MLVLAASIAYRRPLGVLAEIMNINTLLGSNTSTLFGTTTSSSQSATAASAVPQSLQKADKRVQAGVDATTAQLSSFGLLKSAISGSQAVAHSLSNLSASATVDDLTKAAGNFFNAFNATVNAAKNATSASGSAAASQSASRILRETRSALTLDPATQDAMKKLGMSIQSDGSLTQDTKKFAVALASDPTGVRAAMATLGKRVDGVATKELASDGPVGAAVASLTLRGTSLAAQQKALKALEASIVSAQSTSASAQTTATSGMYGSGLAAYQAGLTGF
jgi:hypothetical protein